MVRQIESEQRPLERRYRQERERFESQIALLEAVGLRVAFRLGRNGGRLVCGAETARFLGVSEIDEKRLRERMGEVGTVLVLEGVEGLWAWREQTSPEETPVRLTKREGQVFDLLLQGMRAKEMASALGVSSRTVEKHLENVYRKFGVKHAGELLFREGG